MYLNNIFDQIAKIGFITFSSGDDHWNGIIIVGGDFFLSLNDFRGRLSFIRAQPDNLAVVEQFRVLE